MKTISRKVAEFIEKKSMLTFPIDYMTFGIEIILTQLIIIVFQFIISYIFFSINSMLCFMVPLVCIRTFSGGYHCEKFSSCFLITNFICFGSIIFAKIIYFEYFYNGILLLSVLTIIGIGTKKTSDRSKANVYINKLISCIFCTLFGALYFCTNDYYANIIALSFFSIAVSIFLNADIRG